MRPTIALLLTLLMPIASLGQTEGGGKPDPKITEAPQESSPARKAKKKPDGKRGKARKKAAARAVDKASPGAKPAAPKAADQKPAEPKANDQTQVDPEVADQNQADPEAAAPATTSKTDETRVPEVVGLTAEEPDSSLPEGDTTETTAELSQRCRSFDDLGREISIEGSVDCDEVKGLLAQGLELVQACYASELARSPGLQGEAVLDFAILPTGAVSNPKLTEDTLNNKAVESCALQAVQGLAMPRPSDGLAVFVRYPVTFKPEVVPAAVLSSQSGPGEVQRPDGQTPISDFVDTRISFSFSDDDFLAGPGDTRPNSPSMDFAARRANKLFFENLNSRDTGQETMTHVVLYKHLPGYFAGIDTEAALVMRFQMLANDETGKRSQSFYDDGTYLKLGWFPGGVVDEDALNFTLTLFPFDTNRFRLGYLYDISWGGPEIFPSKGVSAPGAKAQMNWGPFYLFGGAKTARLLDEGINEIESNWGFLGGLGIDIAEMISVEAGGGYFNRGTNPNAGVEGEPVVGYGGSTRLVFHYGTGAGSSVDFRLYRNDLGTTDLFLQNGREFKPKFSAFAAVEYTLLQQTLQDGNPGKLTTTVAQTAQAAALTTKLRLWYFDLGADVIYRDLPFVVFNRAGYVPFQDFPSDVILEPEIMFAASVAAHAPVIRSTFAAVIGAQMPSTFNGGSQTVVVRNAGSVDILPCQTYDDPTKADRVCVTPYTRSPIWALRLAAKFDVSPMLSLVAETTAIIDNNQTDIIDDEQGQVSRAFISTGDLGFPLRFGAGLFAQVRF